MCLAVWLVINYLVFMRSEIRFPKLQNINRISQSSINQSISYLIMVRYQSPVNDGPGLEVYLQQEHQLILFLGTSVSFGYILSRKAKLSYFWDLQIFGKPELITGLTLKICIKRT